MHTEENVRTAFKQGVYQDREYTKVVYHDPVMDFYSFSNFSNILSAGDINILGLYKAFWYTGSAFTRYFNHNKDQDTLIEQSF